MMKHLQRYSRQTILPNFGEENQQKLLNSKVLVIGAGGLGCPVLSNLCAAGVGTIAIVDGDTVAISNLHRQLLYNEEDIGKNKAFVAQEKLQRLNAQVQIEAIPNFIEKENIFELIPHFDIVVDCTDHFGARYLINDVCYLFQKPLVFASIYQFEAQVSVFNFGKTQRQLRDIFPEIPNANQVPNCSDAGVLGAVTSIIGNIQALEVIKMITHIGKVISGKIMLYNTENHTITNFDIPENSTKFCPKTKQSILNTDYHFYCENKVQSVANKEKLLQMLSHNDTCVLDIRNKDEIPKITDFQAIEIPMNELHSHAFEQILTYKNIVIICQSGQRSLKVTTQLQNTYPHQKFYTFEGGVQNLIK